MSVHIHSAGEEGLLSGDVAGPSSLPDGASPLVLDHNSDPVQSIATRRDLFSRFADRPVLVIGGHYDAGHIKRDGDAFRFVT